MNSINELNFQPPTPAEVKARKRKLWAIGGILGGMLVIIIVIITIMISYSIGYNNGVKDESSKTTKIKAGESLTVDDTGSENTDTDAISGNAAQYQTQAMVGQDQIPDHFRGKEGASIRMIEYADFTCSYCVALSQNLGDIYDKYGDKVQFIYRHYSIGHTYSDITARISEAAYLTGGEDAYWKMADQLFGNSVWQSSDHLSDSDIEAKIKDYASQIGLDGNNVYSAYLDSANNGIDAKIVRDKDLAKEGNITGTPTIYINGSSVKGTATAIKARLDELLNK